MYFISKFEGETFCGDSVQTANVRSKFQVDRLMELHFKYLNKVRVADEKIEKEKQVRYAKLILIKLNANSPVID